MVQSKRLVNHPIVIDNVSTTVADGSTRLGVLVPVVGQLIAWGRISTDVAVSLEIQELILDQGGVAVFNPPTIIAVPAGTTVAIASHPITGKAIRINVGNVSGALATIATFFQARREP